MKRHILSIGVLLLCALAAVAEAKPATNFNELLGRPRPAASHRLSYGNLPDQFGELWLPSKPGPYPVVIMLHGGCWQETLPGVALMAYIAEDLRSSGIAVWNIEYRRLGTEGGGYPGTFLDVANGIEYLRGVADTYRLDMAHVVIMGHSAGGHLALWAAARSHIAQSSPLYQPHPLQVRAAMTLGGVNDLAAYKNSGTACGAGTIDKLLGAKDRVGQDVYADTSAAAMLPLGVPQVIVSGNADPIVPAHFGDEYAATAKKAGDEVQVIDINGAGHFELIDPTSDAWARIRTSLLTQLK